MQHRCIALRHLRASVASNPAARASATNVRFSSFRYPALLLITSSTFLFVVDLQRLRFFLRLRAASKVRFSNIARVRKSFAVSPRCYRLLRSRLRGRDRIAFFLSMKLSAAAVPFLPEVLPVLVRLGDAGIVVKEEHPRLTSLAGGMYDFASPHPEGCTRSSVTAICHVVLFDL